MKAQSPLRYDTQRSVTMSRSLRRPDLSIAPSASLQRRQPQRPGTTAPSLGGRVGRQGVPTLGGPQGNVRTGGWRHGGGADVDPRYADQNRGAVTQRFGEGAGWGGAWRRIGGAEQRMERPSPYAAARPASQGMTTPDSPGGRLGSSFAGSQALAAQRRRMSVDPSLLQQQQAVTLAMPNLQMEASLPEQEAVRREGDQVGTRTTGRGMQGETWTPPTEEELDAMEAAETATTARGQQGEDPPSEEGAEEEPDPRDDPANIARLGGREGEGWEDILRRRLGGDDFGEIEKAMGLPPGMLLDLTKDGWYIYRHRENGHIYAIPRQQMVNRWNSDGGRILRYQNPDFDDPYSFLDRDIDQYGHIEQDGFDSQGIHEYFGSPSWNVRVRERQREAGQDPDAYDANQDWDAWLERLLGAEPPTADPAFVEDRIRARQREQQLADARNLRAMNSAGARAGVSPGQAMAANSDMMHRSGIQADMIRSEEQLQQDIRNFQAQMAQYQGQINMLTQAAQSAQDERMQARMMEHARQMQQLQAQAQRRLMDKQFELSQSFGPKDAVMAGGSLLGGVMGMMPFV